MVGLTRNAAPTHAVDRIRINGLNIGWTETEGEDATQRASTVQTTLVSGGRRQDPWTSSAVSEIAEFVLFPTSPTGAVWSLAR